jgi:hypothetical protein
MIHPNSCQKCNSTMIEGLHDDPDWTRINHSNPSIKKITVKTEENISTMIGRITG